MILQTPDILTIAASLLENRTCAAQTASEGGTGTHGGVATPVEVSYCLTSNCLNP
jgi:hypothetical protein